jgi:hypothetical protein
LLCMMEIFSGELAIDAPHGAKGGAGSPSLLASADSARQIWNPLLTST